MVFFNLHQLNFPTRASKPGIGYFLRLRLKLFWYLFVFSDDEALCLASDFRRFNPTSGTRNCNVLPTYMSRNNSKRHGIFQELCNMSSTTSQSCHVELNSWLLSFSSSTRPVKQGLTVFLQCSYLVTIFIPDKTIPCLN